MLWAAPFHRGPGALRRRRSGGACGLRRREAAQVSWTFAADRTRASAIAIARASCVMLLAVLLPAAAREERLAHEPDDDG